MCNKVTHDKSNQINVVDVEQYLPPKCQVAEKQKYPSKITLCCKKYPEVILE